MWKVGYSNQRSSHFAILKFINNIHIASLANFILSNLIDVSISLHRLSQYNILHYKLSWITSFFTSFLQHTTFQDIFFSHQKIITFAASALEALSGGRIFIQLIAVLHQKRLVELRVVKSQTHVVIFLVNRNRSLLTNFTLGTLLGLFSQIQIIGMAESFKVIVRQDTFIMGIAIFIHHVLSLALFAWIWLSIFKIITIINSGYFLTSLIWSLQKITRVTLFALCFT